jgi:transcriptional regulator GlxA family with amidase domain
VHWRFAREFTARYPQVVVDPRRTWIRDGNVYTSAGLSAAIDLALAWVEEDCGAAVSLSVARELVLFLRRPGGQDQLSVSLEAQASHTHALGELPAWMLEHLRRPLRVEALADRVAMSPRNFARLFAEVFHTTPSRYLRQLRIEAALRLLEQTDQNLPSVASAAGFGSADVMRRAFLRTLGTTPRRYRRRLRTAAAPMTTRRRPAPTSRARVHA